MATTLELCEECGKAPQELGSRCLECAYLGYTGRVATDDPEDFERFAEEWRPTARPSVLANLLTQAERFIRRFVVFTTRHQLMAIVLWVAHVYAVKAAAAAAYLRIKSAAEESGKTTLLEVLELLLGERGINAVSISPSVVFRLRDKVGPVALLLDEVDNTIRSRQDDGARDLLALVNGGYRRSATVYRSDGRTFEPRAFQAFGPAAIAGIGHLHPTTESRCIPIVLDRKARGEGERWLRFLVEDEGRALAEGFDQWATEETIARLKGATPTIPEGLRDRHVEVWWALWNIAELAGGEWPALARDAAVALHLNAEETDTMSVGVLLLAHIRAAFDEDGADRLATGDLLRLLVSSEEGPWAKWWGTEVRREETPQAAAADLARHLRAFKTSSGEKVKPRKIRIGDYSVRGYLREDFEFAWARYLSAPNAGGGTAGTPGTPLASNVPPVPPVPGGYPESEPVPSFDQIEHAWGSLAAAHRGALSLRKDLVSIAELSDEERRRLLAMAPGRGEE